MGLKILHSADWHLDAPFAGFSPEQRRFLQQEQFEIPRKIVDLALREDCDLMLLAGDLFDGQPSRETVENLKDELGRSGIPVLISPGNHDYCRPGSPWMEETWPENIYIFRDSLEGVSISGLHCRIYGAAFTSMDSPGLLEGFTAEREQPIEIALLHGDPSSGTSPCNPITAPQIRGSGLDYLALGHIHKAGSVKGGNTLCAWPGCPMGRGWDETGDKGVCIVTLGDSPKLRAVMLDTPRFHDLEADISGDAFAAVEALLPAAETRDFYRITLTGQGEADLAALQAAFPAVTFRDRSSKPTALWENAGDDSLEGVYFDLLRQGLDTPDAKLYQLAAQISRDILNGKEVSL